MNPKEGTSSLNNRRKLIQEKLNKQPKALAGRYKLQKNVIGQGVSSQVYTAFQVNTNRKVAIKKITKFLQNKHQSLRILREIILLRMLEHPNIIKLREVILEQDQSQLYLVLDYFPYDLKKIFKSNFHITLENIKEIGFQLLCALKYCHQCQVLHRDLKPQNILTTQNYSEVKLCDFGLARAVMTQQQKQYQQKIEQKKLQQQTKQIEKQVSHKSAQNLSVHVATRWYRAPELIILQKKYNSAIDMWSVGCIIAELAGMMKQNQKGFMARKVLFPGKACYPLSPPKNNQTNYKKINDFPHSVSDQLSVIFQILGTPEDVSFITDQRAKNYIKSFGKIPKKPFQKIYNYIPKQIEDFLQKSLKFNPSQRLTIQEALAHPLFDDVRQKFKQNASIEGQPVITDIQGLSLQQIKERILHQCEYYKKLKKEEQVKVEKKEEETTE